MEQEKTGGGDAKRCIALIALLILAALLWHTWLVYPLKILIVFFHELSHGLAAVLSGGSIERITLVAAEGGLCVTRGGNRFLVLSAGYLGSLVWGGAILILAARTRYDRVIAGILGGLIILVALAYVRPVISFGFLFAGLAGLALVLVGIKLSEDVNDFVLKLIGLVSCLYVPLDILSDVLARPSLPSDAAMLADLTGVPTLVWGVLWAAAALAASGYFIATACAIKPR